MGTNYYTVNGKHIGKRSAAGMYCWGCKKTLCREGEKRVHDDSKWFDCCPLCGKKPEIETLEQSSAGRELGFNKSKPTTKTGVKSCSSFTWAIDPKKFMKSKIKWVKDEYRRKITKQDFIKILDECPVQFTNSIGQDFS